MDQNFGFFFLRYRIIKIYLYVVDVKVKEFHGGNEKRGNEWWILKFEN